MAHYKRRAAIEETRDCNDGIVTTDRHLNLKVVFHDEVPLEAERLIREHGFLISPRSAQKEKLILY